MTQRKKAELGNSGSIPFCLPTVLYLVSFTALLISAGYVALTNYHQITDTAGKRSESSADLTAELVANNLLSTKFALQAFAASIEPLADQTRALEDNQLERINQALGPQVFGPATTSTLYVTDLSGSLLYASSSLSSNSLPGWSLLRDYLNNHSGEDFVSPLIPDPDTGDFWFFRIRQLKNTNGEPTGFIVLRQSPDALAATLSQLSLLEGQSIAILDKSMKLLARRPLAKTEEDILGQKVSEINTRQFIESGQRNAQVVAESPIDGLRRFYGFSRVADTPYLVVVGEETSVTLAGWKSGLWASSLALIVAGVVGLFFLKQFYRRVAVERELIVEIRERRALQRSAQINEARLQALVDSIPDIIFVFDKSGHFEFVHAADESKLLLPAEDALGLHYHEVLPKELSCKFDGIKSAVSESHDNQTLEYQLFIEGEAKNFEARISKMAGNRGEYDGFLAVVRDITDIKRQEAELKISSTAFETHLGIMITDEAGRILRANQAFSRITGYAEYEVVGRTPKILQSGLQDVAFYHHLWSRVNDAGSWEGEIWNRKKNGEIFAEWLTITAVRDASGRLRNFVGTFHDITKRKEAEREVHRLAFYDSLTGLANRASLQERLSEVCQTSSRKGTHAALLYVDVDQFRAVNDARGYEVGDLVLKSLAGLLSSLVRECDTLARISGDEFAILITDLHASREAAARAAEAAAEKVLKTTFNPIVIADHEVQIEVSVGIAMIDSKAALCEQQLQRAEQATQQAKGTSGHRENKRIAFFDPDIQARIVQDVLMEEELRNAIAGDEMTLFFQPQIQQPDHLTGYEALLRWNHPLHGMVSPGIFIPLAEQSRLILPIGRWVIEQACQKLAHWQEHPDKTGLSLAVNVSVVQFQSGDFINHLADILDQTGAPPHLLKLEVTESLLMDHPRRMAKAMMRIRDMGVRFSLDDFGTGYSSMSYLNRLPLDQIKIDQSFVKEVTSSHANAAIVNSVIGLANGLGLEVIAEGVETEAQRAWLVEHGCRNFQGYLFGKPSHDCLRGELLES